MSNEEIREKILAEAMADLKTRAGEVITDIMSGLYGDYLPLVVSDTDSNISSRVEGCLRNIMDGYIERHSDNLSWVDDTYGNRHLINVGSYNLILKPLCDLMGDTIQSNRIKQLEDEVESLRSQLKDAYRR